MPLVLARRLALSLALCAGFLGAGAADAAAPPKSAKAAAAKGAAAKAPPDPRVWAIAKGDGTYVLRFGAPKDAEPDFAMICQPSAQLLQITAEIAGRPFASGEGVPLTLTNGKRRLELAATAFLGAADGNLVVEAAVALEPRVFDLIGAGDTLVLRIPAREARGQSVSLTFPLASLRGRGEDFRRACLERR